MWAPADLFTPALGIVLFPIKEGVSYFYEHLAVLALTLIAVAALITAVTLLRNRLGNRRTRGT